jgi:hypothetical protein
LKKHDEFKVSALVALIFITLIAMVLTYFIPDVETHETEEGIEGETSAVSYFVEVSNLEIYTRIALTIFLFTLFFAVIFLIKNNFKSIKFLKWIWILVTPFYFVSYYMDYQFQKLPCPKHHELEFPMMISYFIFLLFYFIMLIIITIGTVSRNVKRIRSKDQD